MNSRIACSVFVLFRHACSAWRIWKSSRLTCTLSVFCLEIDMLLLRLHLDMFLAKCQLYLIKDSEHHIRRYLWTRSWKNRWAKSLRKIFEENSWNIFEHNIWNNIFENLWTTSLNIISLNIIFERNLCNKSLNEIFKKFFSMLSLGSFFFQTIILKDCCKDCCFKIWF